MAVTLTKSDWSGEQVNVQKRLKKFSLHAGQDDISLAAVSRLLPRASSFAIVSRYLRLRYLWGLLT